MKNKNVLVIGSGVSGLSSALFLLKAGFNVTILSKEAAGQLPLTSANAYAMWVPVNMDADPRIKTWCFDSLKEFREFAKFFGSGVVLRDIFQLQTHKVNPWFDGVADFRFARAGEIPEDYTTALVLENSPVIDPSTYLPWLSSEVLAAGGIFKQDRITCLDSFGEFDIVINCTGSASRQLALDALVFEDQVLTVKVKNHGRLHRVVIDDEGPNKRACVVPQGNYIRLGALFGDKAAAASTEESVADILSRCNRIAPELRATADDVIDVICAPRPERQGWLPRVELEKRASGNLVIHNYGHDGMGYLLSIGIAKELVSMVRAALAVVD